MKNLLYKISLTLVLLIAFVSCQEEYPIIFDSSSSVIGFNRSTLTVKENDQSGTIKIYLGGVLDLASTEVTLEVSTDGIAKPAVEEVDFTVSSKNVSIGVGETEITISPINNEVFQGNKQFKLIIASNSKSYPISAQKTVTVTITDDEHPLKNWIGTYKVDAASYGDPGPWDEQWTVTTEAHPTDLNKLIVKGIGTSDPSTTGWIGVVDATNLTITFSPGQELDHAYARSNGTSYGPVLLYLGTPDLTTIKDSNIVGTLFANGNIHIDKLAIELTGANAGAVWDTFNTTWTKQ